MAPTMPWCPEFVDKFKPEADKLEKLEDRCDDPIPKEFMELAVGVKEKPAPRPPDRLDDAALWWWWGWW